VGGREGKTVKLMSLAHFTAFNVAKAKQLNEKGKFDTKSSFVFGLDLIAEAVGELVLMVSVEPWEKQIVEIEFSRWKKPGGEVDKSDNVRSLSLIVMMSCVVACWK
jgi:hypothetical protein